MADPLTVLYKGEGGIFKALCGLIDSHGAWVLHPTTQIHCPLSEINLKTSYVDKLAQCRVTSTGYTSLEGENQL